MNIARYFRVQRKNILVAKVLDTFVEDGIQYTAYRMWAYRILTVNGTVVRKELLSYQDWCFGEHGVEQTYFRYQSTPFMFDEIIIK